MRTDGVRRTQAFGVLGLAVIVVFTAVSLGTYRHMFSSDVEVTLSSDRAGLLLEPGSEVKVRGLQVGEVRSVSRDGDKVRIVLALDHDKARYVPRDTAARIVASSVFGGKQVVLDASGAPAREPVTSGAVLRVASVTPEINDLFQQLSSVLEAVPVDELASTLSTVSNALAGRGSKLGEFLSALRTYVLALNGHSSQIARDLELASPVLNTYAEIAPQLTALLDHSTVIGETVHARNADIRALLDRFSTLGADGTELTSRISEPLVRSLHILRPVTELVEAYSPQFDCLLTAFSRMATQNRVLGYKQPGTQVTLSFLPGQETYKYPRDLPRFVSGAGPQCYSLPDVAIGGGVGGAPRRGYADGSHVYDQNGNTQDYGLGKPPVQLFLDGPGGGAR